MLIKLLLQYIIVVSDYDNCPELCDWVLEDHSILDINYPLPLSLDICKDVVCFFTELEKRQLYEQYYFIIKSKTHNIHLSECIRIIKNILKLYDMLAQIHDILSMLLQTDQNIDDKTMNSIHECRLFLKKYADICEIPFYIYRDHYEFTLDHQDDTFFFINVLADCFQDIYALQYLVNQTQYNSFRYYILSIYEELYENINDIENWDIMICDPETHEPVLMSHVYLPHPEDFRLLCV